MSLSTTCFLFSMGKPRFGVFIGAGNLDSMRQGGIDAGLEKFETDTELVLTISIPKQK